MGRKCTRCHYEIDAVYILKQDSKEQIICPNCGRTLEATKISKAVMLSIFIMFFLLFLILPITIINKILVEVLWYVLSKNVVTAFIYEYEEKKDEAN